MIGSFIKVKMRNVTYFKTSLIFDLMSTASFILVNLVFWDVIYGKVDNIGGLTKSSMYYYLFLVEIFHIMYMGFFSGSSKVWREIIPGNIDKFLILPRHPFYSIMCNGIDPFTILKSIPLIFGMFVLVISTGHSVDPFVFLYEC